MKRFSAHATFNRGRVSKLGLARSDVRRIALSAETQTNWMPRVLGSMMLRPGMEKIGALAGDGRLIPFIYTSSDKAIIDLTPGTLQVWDGGSTLLTRNGVSASVTNGAFTADISGWTDASDAGCTTAWATGGYAELTGNTSGSARLRQQVTVTEQSTEHALEITVERGPLLLRIGSSAGEDDIFRQAALRTGHHNIAFTPGAASFWIEFASSLSYPVQVGSVAVAGSGTVSLATPWADADTCKLVREDQSGEVIFAACSGVRPQRIERRPNNSWSIVDYAPEDGPLLVENTSNTTITVSALSGEVTLTASQPIWNSDHVGALFRIESSGQKVEEDIAAENTFSNPIRVTGVESDRAFVVVRSGTWAGTVTLQRSIGEVGDWVDDQTWTANGTVTVDDGLDNSIIFYRIGIKSGEYTSGTASVSLDYPSGSITGMARLTAVASSTSATCVALEDFGSTVATSIWAEGAWSAAQTWPQAVSIWEGRAWWSSEGKLWGSVSDGFSTFDPDYIGDAAPLNKGLGPEASYQTNWLLPLERLVVGTDTAEQSVRSSSFDEVVTPSNYNIKSISKKGSASVPAIVADDIGFFVGRDTRNIFEIAYSEGALRLVAQRATVLVPEIGDEGFEKLASQMSPDLRVHGVLGDGSSAVLIRDPAEDVTCWVNVESQATIEDAIMLPGIGEDEVYYRVAFNGTRYLVKWALESECQGGTVNKQADLFVTGTGPVSTLTGLDHLDGYNAVVWADGKDKGTFAVSGGEVDLGETVTDWVAGLGYTADFKSAKLAAQTEIGPTLTQKSRIDHVGFVLSNTHAKGLQYGPDFDNLDEMPDIEDWDDVADDTIHAAYDKGMIEFPGAWDEDVRLCLRAQAPRPCTILAAVLSVE